MNFMDHGLAGSKFDVLEMLAQNVIIIINIGIILSAKVLSGYNFGQLKIWAQKDCCQTNSNTFIE